MRPYDFSFLRRVGLPHLAQQHRRSNKQCVAWLMRKLFKSQGAPIKCKRSAPHGLSFILGRKVPWNIILRAWGSYVCVNVYFCSDVAPQESSVENNPTDLGSAKSARVGMYCPIEGRLKAVRVCSLCNRRSLRKVFDFYFLALT